MQGDLGQVLDPKRRSSVLERTHDESKHDKDKTPTGHLKEKGSHVD